MDQRQLERFVDVVESGSLSRTSRRMNISQPALSKSLRLIEEQLGMKLLERGPRGVRVTKFGDIFYRRACSIAAQFRRTWEELEELRGSTAGQVTLGATPGPGILDRIIPAAIARIAQKRPSLRFSVRSGSSQDLLPALHQGAIDVLFTVLDDQIKGPDLKAERLFEDHFVMVVNRKHPLLAKQKITLSDLTSCRWVFLQDAKALWQAVEDNARAQQIAIQAPMESNSVVFVRAMVEKGQCIGVLPSYAAESGADMGSMVFLPMDRITESCVLPRLALTMGVVHSTATVLTPAGEALLRSIKTVCHEIQTAQPKRRANAKSA